MLSLPLFFFYPFSRPCPLVFSDRPPRSSPTSFPPPTSGTSPAPVSVCVLCRASSFFCFSVPHGLPLFFHLFQWNPIPSDPPPPPQPPFSSLLLRSPPPVPRLLTPFRLRLETLVSCVFLFVRFTIPVSPVPISPQPLVLPDVLNSQNFFFFLVCFFFWVFPYVGFGYLFFPYVASSLDTGSMTPPSPATHPAPVFLPSFALILLPFFSCLVHVSCHLTLCRRFVDFF